MPQHMAQGFAFDIRALIEAAERRRAGRTVRTLLAGPFAASDNDDRAMIADTLAEPAGGWRHNLVPLCGDDEPGLVAEATLAAGGADLVLLDLDGPVPTLLALIERLRAAASESVAFIGIMPSGASRSARLYLSAVLDGVVPGPLRAASLHWALTDALQSVPAFFANHRGPATQGLVTWH